MRHSKIKQKKTFCNSGVWIFGLILLFSFTTGVYSKVSNADTSKLVAKCAECHEDLAKGFKMGPHFTIDTKGLAKGIGADFSCGSCHGDLKKHIEDAEAGNIFAFKSTDPTTKKSNQCLKCHKDNKADYFASSHAKAALDCTECHSVHKKTKRYLLKSGPTKSCYKCHQDVFAKFNLNEKHKLKEGALKCGDCHDPHKPAATERLAGFKQEACFKCHTNKQGPFLYEHNAVRVEGCTACHDVHGSPNRHMLITQSVSELCYSCHSRVPGWHSRFTPESNCVSCHSTIHGSNFNPKFVK